MSAAARGQAEGGDQIWPPERVLEELYQTGRHWMGARARERGIGPVSDWGKGEPPPSKTDHAGQERAGEESSRLRDRFTELAREFLERMEHQ
jgi:hypothetical protein